MQLGDALRLAARMINDGRLAEAENLLLTLRRSAPADPWIAFNLALVWWRHGRRQEAIEAWAYAIRVKPDFGEAAINLSNALVAVGRGREALEYSRLATQLRPEVAGAWRNLAASQLCVINYQGALASIERCLALRGDDPLAHQLYLDVLGELGRHEDRARAARRLLALPGQGANAYALQALYQQAAAAGRWDELAELGRAILAAVTARDAQLSMLPLMWLSDDPQLLSTLARVRAATFPAPAATAAPRRPAERITVGYMSPDLGNHPVMHMLLSLLPAHDRSRFRILSVGLVPRRAVPLCDLLDSLCDGHLDLGRIDDAAAAERIRAAGIDVLVDIAGQTHWSRPGILALRPAPVQALWMGFAASTGLPYYDAFLSDALAAPEGYEAHCREPLLRLPCCYHPITTGPTAPDPSPSRRDYGLPEQAVVCAVFSNAKKLRPELLEMTARVLRAQPGTVLWLALADGEAFARIRSWLAERGLDPAQVVQAPRESERARYLGRMQLADLIIDTYPYGGHSTAGEAIVQGVPLLTRAGEAMHTRVAASMLHQAGLDELVTWSAAAFAERLAGLIADRAALAGLRQRCRAAGARLAADGQRTLAGALETAYRGLLERVPLNPAAAPAAP